MNRQRRIGIVAIPLLIALVIAAMGTPGSAQYPMTMDGSPTAGTPEASPIPSSQGITLVAGGLVNPRGFGWGPDGNIYIALAGNGITSMGKVSNPQNYQYGPFFGENTASVARIDIRLDVDAIGCPVAVAGGLPSTHGMSGHDQGPADVVFLDDQMYVLQDGGDDAAKLAPNQPNGIYRANPDGTLALVLDMLKWHDANPVAHIPYDAGPESETFSMLAGEGFIWLLESNAGQVIKVTPDGQATRVVDLSEGHPVPTGFALSGDGGVYVGFLTSAPYTDGSSKVIKVMPDGTVTDVWTGLTAITALAVGADGTLYALEMATGNIDTPPFTLPHTGKIVRQTGPDTQADVVTGLDYPIAMEMGPDNALYVAFPAFGADPPIGGILRADLRYSQPMVVSPDVLNLDICDVADPSEAAPDDPGDPMGSPAADPMGSPVTTPISTGGKTETGAVAIVIKDFAFTAASIEVPAGTVITFTNQDSTAHTATAQDGSFNSGNLNPGESYSITLDKPGAYAYNCSYHPNMTGTIVVK